MNRVMRLWWGVADQNISNPIPILPRLMLYKRLIHTADQRYDEHVGSLAPQAKESQHGKKIR